MIIEDIKEVKKNIKDEIYNSLKKYCKYNLILWAVICLGSIIFFYIEECHYFTPNKDSSDQCSSQKLCNDILGMNSTHSNNSDIMKAISNLTAICSQQQKNNEVATPSFAPASKNCYLDSVYFAKWLSYMVTVVFTIGFGIIVPKSTPGRALTILFALCGIPIATVTTMACGKTIDGCIKYLIIGFEEKILKRKQIVWFKRKVALVEVSTTMTLILLSALYKKTEGFHRETYFDCVYYIFIMMTTIGFGDMQPDPKHRIERLEDSHISLFIDVLFDIFLFIVTFSMMAAFISALTSVGDEDSEGKKTEEAKTKKTKPIPKPVSKIDHEEVDPNLIAIKNLLI
ncbi:potassium channel subfamily K member 9-like [Clytia hemisphaerica]|uniref:Potassium channel domain-containing protein n=1 Tax=Clytia hemisphaerica TaxID=252671 RepID=A0A7M5V937_9CNID|eukprot:TCONS_00073042-protein